MKVAVLGAGKMGLPIACQLAANDVLVQACDINEALVAAINRGECPFDEPGLSDLLSRALASHSLRGTTDVRGAIATSDVIIVIVPVLLTADRGPDLERIRCVAMQIGESIKRGALVIFETTLPVGTTRALMPLLEARGWRAGHDFDLVFSPERVKSRSVLKHLNDTPKIVGGYTPEAAERAARFYRECLHAPVLDVGSLEAAEFAKLAGMVYRDVNIALANELAAYAEAIGVDFGTIAAAANTDGEAALLSPGIGVGGHCTPVYPYFLLRDAADRGVQTVLTSTARIINDVQPDRAISRLEASWQCVAGKRVLLLGLGFRPDVKEHIHSPAFQLREALARRGAFVELCDPLYTVSEIQRHGFKAGSLDDECAADALILVTAHRSFLDIDFKSLATRGLKAVVDGRNVWNADKVHDASVVYIGVGRSTSIGDHSGGSDDTKRFSPIPTSQPHITTDQGDAARRVIMNGWTAQGPEISAFNGR